MAKSKHLGKPHKRARGQYLPLSYAMIKHPSFKALSADAVRVLIQMHLDFHGYNNGQVGFNIRQAAERLHSGQRRVIQAFDELQEYGFIVCITQSSFNMKTNKAWEWEITLQPMPSGLPSHA